MEVETKPDTKSDSTTKAAWHAVLAVEGVRTADRREFAPGSLRWRALPLPLMYQPATDERHKGSVVVGRIDRIERHESEIHGWGIFDLGSEQGREAHRLVTEQIMRGVSIDAELFSIDRERLEGDPEDGGMVIYVEEARIGATTIVHFPAFPQAVIALADADIPTSTEDGRGEALPSISDDSAFVFIDSPTLVPVSEAPWHPFESTYTATQALTAAAARRGSTDDLSDFLLLHHEPNGFLSRQGLRIAASMWHQIQAPPAAKSRARHHLISHFRRELKEEAPKTLNSSALLAHADSPGPPASWFTNPELKAHTPLTIARNGRIYAHIAAWDACHTGYNECMRPPKSRTNYAYFLTGAVFASDCDCDGPIPTGPIVMNTTHANGYAPHDTASRHYDNTGLAVADVAVGEDEYGIWIAGALRPGVTEAQIRALRGSSLSGDWRHIAGSMELISILAVNTPGFPIPRVAASVDNGVQVSLIAAGIPEDSASTAPDPASADPTSLLEELKQERQNQQSPDPDTDQPDADEDAPDSADPTPDDQPNGDNPDATPNAEPGDDDTQPNTVPDTSSHSFGIPASDLISQLKSSLPLTPPPPTPATP